MNACSSCKGLLQILEHVAAPSASIPPLLWPLQSLGMSTGPQGHTQDTSENEEVLASSAKAPTVPLCIPWLLAPSLTTFWAQFNDLASAFAQAVPSST